MPILPAKLGLRMKKGFLPSDIGGMLIWLDANKGTFDNTTGGSLVTSDSASVARWEDQSGNGRHISQAVSGSRPILKTLVQNGKNILRFNGLDDHLFMLSAFIYAAGASTIFCVVSPTPTNPPIANSSLITERNSASSNANYLAIGNGSSDATRLRVFARDDSNNNILFGGSSTFQSAAGTAFNGSYQLLSTIDTGTNVTMYINKTSSASANYTRGILTLDRFTVGASRVVSASAFFACDLGEIIIYNSALSTSDRQTVENYLYSKWAIA